MIAKEESLVIMHLQQLRKLMLKRMSVVADLYSSIPSAPDVTPGLSSIEEGSADEIPGVDLADVAVLNKPTGVDMGVPQANTPQVFDDAVFDTDLDGGLDAEPPMLETPADTPSSGMAARNARVRKPPEKFIPSMQGSKYEIALAQITASLGKSKNSLAFAQISVKLMNKGDSQCPMDPMVAWETKNGEEWVLRLLYYLRIYGNTPPQSTVYEMLDRETSGL